jgi:hypothetical protein
MNAMNVGRYLLLPVLFVAVVSCSDSSTKGRIVVRGQVTVDGKPAEGVTLSFFAPNERVAVAIVTTQADGSYEVMFNSHAGEGNYRVTAKKIPIRGQVSEGIDEYQLQLAGESANMLPARYADPAYSGITISLQPGVNEGKNIALKSR